MSKVAIVTIISKNYGNRLQNYALQEVLKQMGVDVETIPMRAGKQSIKSDFKYLIKTLINCVGAYYPNVTWERFDKNITWGPYPVNGCENLLEKRYEYFIAGSDQIWNPVFECNSDREFLVFTTAEKKIAYAASIGLDELPNNEIDRYRKYISAFRAVSVREKSAANIIENLGCPRPKVVLDPTMLLSEEEWKVVIKQSNIKIKERYVVSYFLGIRTAEFDSYINQKATEMGVKLIDIMKLPSNIKDKIGPAEFISLLYNSEEIFTDSFHGTVFSILFHKPFVVFERPYEEGYGKMSSRLDTLLETFDLNEQRVNSKEKLDMIKPEYYYLKVDNILKEKRKESIDFLKSTLNK